MRSALFAIVFVAACSNGGSSSDANNTGTDSGSNDSGTPADAGPDGGPDSGTSVVDSGPTAPLFFGAGDAGAFTSTTPLLLVDNDNSENNNPATHPSPTLSVSDKLYVAVLNKLGTPYTIWVVPGDGSGASRPTPADLAGVGLVLWYTGANNKSTGNGTVTASQEAALMTWLDEGNKTLGMFSEYLVGDLENGGAWCLPGEICMSPPPRDALIMNYIGAQQALQTPDTFLADAGVDTSIASVSPSFTVAGAGQLLGGMNFNVGTDGGPSFIPATAAILQPPDSGVDTLATVEADPADTMTDIAAAVAVGHHNFAVDGGTSSVVYVSFPVEDIRPTSQITPFLTEIGVYLGLI
jgi:hypothetical protein